MRSFTLISTLALSFLSASTSVFASPAPVRLPTHSHGVRVASPAPSADPEPFGASVAAAVALAASANAKARVGTSVHKRCDSGCGENDGQEGLLKVLVDFKSAVELDLSKIDGLAVYTTASIGPILSSIHASIVVAVNKCTALVGKADAVVFASIDTSSKVLVTVGQIGSVLARIIISISVSLSKLVLRAGASVCAPHLAEIGLALHALVSVCVELVPDLLKVVVPLVEKVIVDIKACAWADLVALLEVKA